MFDSRLEKEIFNAFKEEGWDCEASKPFKISESQMMAPDITLSKNGHVYGYVECLYRKITPLKQELILHLIEKYKPEVFILADGTNYEVYLKGKYAGVMTVPISPRRFLK